MLPQASVIRRILWPKQASMFVIVGGAAGLMGDMTSFFAAFVSPVFLALLFLLVAISTAWLCFGKASRIDASDDQAVHRVVECGVCDALRFSLGHTSTDADVDAVLDVIGPVVERARRAGLGRR